VNDSKLILLTPDQGDGAIAHHAEWLRADWTVTLTQREALAWGHIELCLGKLRKRAA